MSEHGYPGKLPSVKEVKSMYSSHSPRHGELADLARLFRIELRFYELAGRLRDLAGRGTITIVHPKPGTTVTELQYEETTVDAYSPFSKFLAEVKRLGLEQAERLYGGENND